MAELLITTTPILSNIEIQRYIGPITANVVLGVNFFSDFAASFTDVFGGNSETYQSKLDSLSHEVEKLIKAKANQMGANAIIDYKLQFNEISGKGKQMFMVTATGTGCVIKAPQYNNIVKEIGHVAYTQMLRQYYLTLYRQGLKDQKSLGQKDWENILTMDVFELLPELTNEYFRLKSEQRQDINYIDYVTLYSSKYEEFLSKVNKSDASMCVYSHLCENPELTVDLAVKFNLFNPKVIMEQIKDSNLSIAINLLFCHKDYYTTDDLSDMTAIVSMLDNLPNIGTFHTEKNGIFSKKEEEFYYCPNGHKNTKETVYCSNCGQNIKGLTLNQDKIISQFKCITLALESILH